MHCQAGLACCMPLAAPLLWDLQIMGDSKLMETRDFNGMGIGAKSCEECLGTFHDLTRES